MKMLRTLTVGLITMGLFASSASATTLTVPSDDYPTLQDAFDDVDDGDTIVVKSGTHFGPLDLTNVMNVTVKGKGKPELTALSGTIMEVSGCSNVTISGFVLVGSDASGVRVQDSDQVTISKCLLGLMANEAILIGGGDGHRIEKNSFADIGGYAVILESGEAGKPANCTVAKNKFLGGLSSGLLYEGDNHVIERNTFNDLSGLGISGDSSADMNNRISKNKMTDVADDAITVTGQGDIVEKNKIENTARAIYATGDDVVITKNKIKNCTDEGIDVANNSASVTKNSVTGAQTGIRARGSAGEYEKNKCKDCDLFGFLVINSSNTFTKNSAKGSGTVDLRDGTGGEGNTYDKNKFGTEDLTEN